MNLLLRNLLFTILQPGIVAGVVPFYLGRSVWKNISLQPLIWSHYLGLLIFVIGLIILIACIIQLAVEGKGTLSPADPTKNLVIKGLYKYSRNPMYMGVVLMLIGESLVVQVLQLWIYSGFVLLGFHLFILFHEEPRLTRDFGDNYLKYRKTVRRWI